jgi:hypothetical protein
MNGIMELVIRFLALTSKGEDVVRWTVAELNAEMRVAAARNDSVRVLELSRLKADIEAWGRMQQLASGKSNGAQKEEPCTR